MAGKRKFFFALALVIALVGFALFVLNRSENRSNGSQRFPDGSTLQLGSIQFTNGSFSYTGTGYMGWRGKIARFLPKNLVSRLGWLQLRGSITIYPSDLGRTNLCVFTIHEGHNSSSKYYELRVVICDEQGNTFDGGTTCGVVSSADRKNQLRVDAWCPPAFPRRGRRLGLCYYTRGQTNSLCLAEFFIPNPAQGNYPTWTAQPLPATKTNGDLSVTLLSLKSGLSEADETRPAASNEIAVTQAAFRIMEAGSESNAWRPNDVEISDATGNHWVPFPNDFSIRNHNGTNYFSFRGALWPGEAAWKMRFEFSRSGDFQSNEVFTFSGITVPGATQVIRLNNSTNISGCALKLIAISGESANQPDELRWSTLEKLVNISIRVTPVPGNSRLALVKVTDESGREAEIEQQPDLNVQKRVYAFKRPEGAKRLNFTFALHKSQYVEFMVRPEFARTNN